MIATAKQGLSRDYFREAGYWLDKTVDQLLTEAAASTPGKVAVVALDNGDVVRTTDNGMHFAPVLHTGASPTLRFSDADHGILTAGPDGSRQLFSTADGGATWQPVPAPD